MDGISEGTRAEEFSLAAEECTHKTFYTFTPHLFTSDLTLAKNPSAEHVSLGNCIQGESQRNRSERFFHRRARGGC